MASAMWVLKRSLTCNCSETGFLRVLDDVHEQHRAHGSAVGPVAGRGEREHPAGRCGRILRYAGVRGAPPSASAGWKRYLDQSSLESVRRGLRGLLREAGFIEYHWAQRANRFTESKKNARVSAAPERLIPREMAAARRRHLRDHCQRLRPRAWTRIRPTSLRFRRCRSCAAPPRSIRIGSQSCMAPTATTWRETYARCRRLASALAARGVGRGDTVAGSGAQHPGDLRGALRRSYDRRGAQCT